MWKLFITVMALSDTGAVSTNVVVSDYNSQRDCTVTAKGISGSIDRNVNGHNFKIITSAQCNGDGTAPPPPQAVIRFPGW